MKKIYLVKKEVKAHSIEEAVKNESKGNIYEVVETKEPAIEEKKQVVGFAQYHDGDDD